MEYNETSFGEGVLDNPEEMNLRSTSTQDAVKYTLIVSHGIVPFILCSCDVVIDVLLIYVITKFQRLKSRVNSYIKHYAIFNILYIILGFLLALLYIIFSKLLAFSFTETVSDFITLFENACLQCTFLLSFVLGLDWLVTTFRPEWGIKVKNFDKYFIPVIYIIGLVVFAIQSSLVRSMEVPPTVLLVIYFSVLLFVTVINFLKYKYNNLINIVRPEYSLTVAEVIVLTWLPRFIYHILYHATVHEGVIKEILIYIYFIPLWMSHSTSIFMIIVLIKKNKYFKMAFRKLFKRSVRNYTDEDNLDDSETTVNNNTENCSNVSYNNTTTSVKLN